MLAPPGVLVTQLSDFQAPSFLEASQDTMKQTGLAVHSVLQTEKLTAEGGSMPVAMRLGAELEGNGQNLSLGYLRPGPFLPDSELITKLAIHTYAGHCVPEDEQIACVVHLGDWCKCAWGMAYFIFNVNLRWL